MNRLDPPAHYDDDRRQVWTATVAALTQRGRIFTTDPDVLSAYVEQVITSRRASYLLTQTDVLVMRDGKAVLNPAVEAQRRSAQAIATLARTLGLNRNPIAETLAESPIAGDGRRWCHAHSRDECKHHRQDGDWCHQYRLVRGLGSCRKHAGMTLEAARAKGAANLARIYTGASMEIDPGAALLWELGHSAALVAELRAKVSELAGAPGPDGETGSGLFWGVTVERDRDGVIERERKAGPHAILRAMNEEAEHMIRTAAAARSTGAMEAQATAARQLAAGLTRLVDTILDGLQLTQYQRDELVPVIVPAAIRSLDLPVPGTAT